MKKISLKILFIIFVIALFLLIFSINSKATFEVTYDNQVYDLPDLPEMTYSNYLIIRNNSSFRIYNFDGNIAFLENYFYDDISDSYLSGFKLLDSSIYKQYNLVSNSRWIPVNGTIVNADYCQDNEIFTKYCYSNVDIYDSIEKNNILHKSSISNDSIISVPVSITTDDFIPLTNIMTDTIYKVLPIAITILGIILVINLIPKIVYGFI